MEVDSLDEAEQAEEKTGRPVALFTLEQIGKMIFSLNKLCTIYDSAENTQKDPRQRVASAEEEWKRAEDILASKKNYPSRREWRDLFAKLADSCDNAHERINNYKEKRKL
jgi:hypothetical protein